MDAITEHHYHNIALGKTGLDKDGNMQSVVTAIVEIDGVETLIPRLWDGEVRSLKDATDFAVESGVNWPTAFGDNAQVTLQEQDDEIHEAFTDETTPEEAQSILDEHYAELNSPESLPSFKEIAKLLGAGVMLGAEKFGIDTSPVFNYMNGGDMHGGGVHLSDEDKNWLTNLAPSYDTSTAEEEGSSVSIYQSLRPMKRPEEPVSSTTGMMGVDEDGNIIEYGFAKGGLPLNLADSMKGRSEEDKDISEEKEQVDVSKADTDDDGFASLAEREIQLALQKNELIDEDQMPMKFSHGGMSMGCGCGGECDGSCGVTGYDEVSGNPIPIGSTAENVRDDIDAKLSTDEYVLPANVVKWHGLKHIMDMQAEAEMGLMSMQMDGLIQSGQEEPNGEGTENAKVSDESDTEQEEAEAKAEAPEVATVKVDDHLDDEEDKEISPKSKPLPAIMKKQKFVFAV